MLCSGTRGATVRPRDAEHCDHPAVFRLMAGTPNGAAYGGGYRVCPSHLNRVVDFFARPTGAYPPDWELRITRLLSDEEEDERFRLPRARRPGVLVATIRARVAS